MPVNSHLPWHATRQKERGCPNLQEAILYLLSARGGRHLVCDFPLKSTPACNPIACLSPLLLTIHPSLSILLAIKLAGVQLYVFSVSLQLKNVSVLVILFIFVFTLIIIIICKR